MELMIASLIFFCGFIIPVNAQNKNELAAYSREKHGWGLMTNKEHKVPVNGDTSIFAKRDAYYYVPTEDSVIYLTFDCGYENGYTNQILDTLKEHHVKALFFVTKSYIRDNADIVKRMKREGHLVGNHTCTHPSMPALSVRNMQKEIQDCADYMKEKTGYAMDHFFRPPMGEWSSQSLKVTQNMGYTSVFWSMAFYDYDVNQQPGADKILDAFLTNYHKGAITLFHVISKSDTEALDSVIARMEEKGYRFGLLSEIADRKAEIHVYKVVSKKEGKVPHFYVSYPDSSANVKCYFTTVTGERLRKAPTLPGVYYVTAYAPATNRYKQAISEPVLFGIGKSRQTER